LASAALAWALAAPALAQAPLFGVFDQVCLSTGARAAAVAPAAKAAGFTPPPSGAFDGLKQGMEEATVLVRAASNGQPQVAFWGRRQLTLGAKPYPARVCAVLDPGADAAAVTAAAAWAGVDPVPTSDKTQAANRVFSGTAGHHTTVANLQPAEAEAMLRKGEVQLLTSGVTPEGHTILVYGVIEPSN
jgi:hypothetical protein